MENLEEALEHQGTPPFPKQRYRGAAAKGIAYERRFGRHLRARTKLGGDALHGSRVVQGPWIWYLDENGEGFAQPDYLVFQESTLFILECKLTHTPLARSQVLDLYKPLCEFIWPEYVILGAEVCYNLDGEHPTALTFDELRGEFSIWHWMR